MGVRFGSVRAILLGFWITRDLARSLFQTPTKALKQQERHATGHVPLNPTSQTSGFEPPQDDLQPPEDDPSTTEGRLPNRRRTTPNRARKIPQPPEEDPSSSTPIIPTIRSRSSTVANSIVILPLFRPMSTFTRVSNRSDNRSANSLSAGA
jgi:hypothetical protein